MKKERNSGWDVIQSNQHLKELNDNIAREQESKYTLSSQHRQQRDQLRLLTDNDEERMALQIQQADENQKLAQQQSDVRLLMQQRHNKERLTLQLFYPSAPKL